MDNNIDLDLDLIDYDEDLVKDIDDLSPPAQDVQLPESSVEGIDDDNFDAEKYVRHQFENVIPEDTTLQKVERRVDIRNDLIRKAKYVNENRGRGEKYSYRGNTSAELGKFIEGNDLLNLSHDEVNELQYAVDGIYSQAVKDRWFGKVFWDAVNRSSMKSGHMVRQSLYAIKKADEDRIEDLKAMGQVYQEMELYDRPKYIQQVWDVRGAKDAFMWALEATGDNSVHMTATMGAFMIPVAGPYVGVATSMMLNTGEAIGDQVEEDRLHRGFALLQGAAYTAVELATGSEVRAARTLTGGGFRRVAWQATKEIRKEAAQKAAKEAFSTTWKDFFKFLIKQGIGEGFEEVIQNNITRTVRSFQTGNYLGPDEHSAWDAVVNDAEEFLSAFVSTIGHSSFSHGYKTRQNIREVRSADEFLSRMGIKEAQAAAKALNKYTSAVADITENIRGNNDFYTLSPYDRAVLANTLISNAKRSSYASLFDDGPMPEDRSKIISKQLEYIDNIREAALQTMSEDAIELLKTYEEAFSVHGFEILRPQEEGTKPGIITIPVKNKSDFNVQALHESKRQEVNADGTPTGNTIYRDPDSGIAIIESKEGDYTVYNDQGYQMPSERNEFLASEGDALQKALRFAKQLSMFNNKMLEINGQKMQLIRAIANRAYPGLNVAGFEGPRSLPDGVRERFVKESKGKMMYGFFDDETNTIYVDVRHVRSPIDAAITLFHESLHEGFRNWWSTLNQKEKENYTDGMTDEQFKAFEESLVSMHEANMIMPGSFEDALGAMVRKFARKVLGANWSLSQGEVNLLINRILPHRTTSGEGSFEEHRIVRGEDDSVNWRNVEKKADVDERADTDEAPAPDTGVDTDEAPAPKAEPAAEPEPDVDTDEAPAPEVDVPETKVEEVDLPEGKDGDAASVAEADESPAPAVETDAKPVKPDEKSESPAQGEKEDVTLENALLVRSSPGDKHYDTINSAEGRPEGSSETFTVITPDGAMEVSGQFDVVDADDFLTGKDAGYYGPFQGRERNSVESQKQVLSIANDPRAIQLDGSPVSDSGSPIVLFKNGSDHVVSGNGRATGLRLAYQVGNAEKYRAHVEQRAKAMGIDTSGMKAPILVRRANDMSLRDGEVFAEKSNADQKLAFTASELAVRDAKVLEDNPQVIRMYNPSDSGNMHAASNHEFLVNFVDKTGDTSLRHQSGKFTDAIEKRVWHALIFRMLGKNTPENRAIITRLAEEAAEYGVVRQVAGLGMAAQTLLDVANSHPDYDLTPALARALEKLLNYKGDIKSGRIKPGTSFAEFSRQLFFDGFDNVSHVEKTATVLAEMLAEAKSVKQIKEFFENYERIVSALIEEGGGLFDELEVTDTDQAAADALQRAREKINGTEEQDIFSFSDGDTAKGQKPSNPSADKSNDSDRQSKQRKPEDSKPKQETKPVEKPKEKPAKKKAEQPKTVEKPAEKPVEKKAEQQKVKEIGELAAIREVWGNNEVEIEEAGGEIRISGKDAKVIKEQLKNSLGMKYNNRGKYWFIKTKDARAKIRDGALERYKDTRTSLQKASTDVAPTETSVDEATALLMEAAGLDVGDAAKAATEQAEQSTEASVEAETVMEEVPAKETPVEQPTEDAADTEQAKQIDDFGEKLEGARKDMPKVLTDDISDSDIASQPFSKTWPNDAHEKIEDDLAAALAFVARENVPAKPRTPYKIKRWVKTVNSMLEIVRDPALALRVVESLESEEISYATKSLLAKAKLLSQLPRNTWKRIGEVRESPNAMTIRSDEELESAGFHKNERGYWLYTTPDGTEASLIAGIDPNSDLYDKVYKPDPNVRVTIDGKTEVFEGVGKIGVEQVEAIQKLLGEKVAPTKGALTTESFEIWGYKNRSDTWYISKKGDPERRVLKEFKGETAVRDARAFLNSNLSEVVSEWEAVKARDNVSEEEARRNANRERKGVERRGGKDVTEQMFTESFGFRGVQFGNWVSQGKNAKERQGMLNQAFDALHDLADVLGIPSQAVSLNGSLGLAFGARGTGKASAHFEPDTLVINLTKTRGAGSLAHEWFHAMDNYFSRMRGERRGYITYAPSTTARLTSSRNFVLPKSGMDSGVRAEIESAFTTLVGALNDSPMTARAKTIDKSQNGYWSRTIERAARSFENYIISKMNERGWSNDYLANIRNFEEWREIGKNAERYPYLLAEEEAPIVAAYDALFNTIETKQDSETGGTIMFRMEQSQIDNIMRAGMVLANNFFAKGGRSFGDFRKSIQEKFGNKFDAYIPTWYEEAASLQQAEKRIKKDEVTNTAEIRSGIDTGVGEEESGASARERTDERGRVLPDAGRSRPADIRGVDQDGRSKRPPLRVAQAQLIPDAPQVVRSDTYSKANGIVLGDDQVLAVNLAIDAFERDRPAFLLADGAGVGKTMVMLATADQFRKRSKTEASPRILIIGQNKQSIQTRFAEDAKALGVSTSGFRFETYSGLATMVKNGAINWDLVIFDEAHNLKNADSQRSMAAAGLRSPHKLFATATPIDKPTGAAYFMAELTGKTEQEVALALGYRIEEQRDEKTGAIVSRPVLLENVSWHKVWANIKMLRNAAIADGTMVRREFPFYGKANLSEKTTLTEAQKSADNRIDMYFEGLIKDAGGSPTAKRNFSGQRTLAWGRANEYRKVPQAVELTEKALSEGKQVIIVAETDKIQSFPVPVEDFTSSEEFFSEDMKRSWTRWYRLGAISRAEALLVGRGITDISHIHDTKNNVIADEMRKFQSGENRVVLMTPQSGGTSIDLDDKSGGKPRMMIVLSKNFAGDQFEQVLYRVSRRNTASPAEVVFLENDGVSDSIRNDILSKKLGTLRAIQGDVDVDDAVGLNTGDADVGTIRFRMADQVAQEFTETEQRVGGRKAYDAAKKAGKTELNYRQWVQVRTPAFKEWFGDWESDPRDASKVVHPETGEPLVVYHATNEDFSEFSREVLGGSTGKNTDAKRALSMAKVGFWFSARDVSKDTGSSATMPVFLNIRQPLRTTFEKMWNGGRGRSGQDGYIVGDSEFNTTSYVALNPTQIKSATGNTGSFSDQTGNIRFRAVSDPAVLQRLEKGETFKAYRAMQVIDGKLYPAMSARADGEFRQPSQFGVWEEAVEQPEAIRQGKFALDKAQKGASRMPVAYNPYIHASNSPLNDQFASAYKRDNLVVVEVEIPTSELTSGYRAEGAKDAVGAVPWRSGPVASKLSGDNARQVYLTRWAKPVRIVPDSEVAQMVKDTLDGTDIAVPSGVVHPALLNELRAAGVPIQESGIRFREVGQADFGPDFRPGRRHFSTKAHIADLLVRFGLEPYTVKDRITNQSTLDEALAIVKERPDEASVIMANLRNSKRPATPVERTILLLEVPGITEGLEQASAAMNEATVGTREHDSATARFEAYSNKAAELSEVMGMAGTAAGQALQAIKIGVFDDFSLAGMMAAASKANNYQPLTPDQLDFVKQFYDEYSKDKAEFERRIGKEKRVGQTLQDLKREARKRKLSPDNYMDRARMLLERKLDAQGGDITKGDLSSVLQMIARAIVTEDPSIQTDPFNVELHKRFFSLVGTIFPDLTQAETESLFSGYGQIQYPSSEEVDVRLRQLRELDRLRSQLRDVEEGDAPLRTGKQRDDSTHEARELQKKINALMKEMGIVSDDPKRQIKTPLDALKQRIRNRIEDLEHAIRNPHLGGLVDNSIPMELDDEAKSLKDRRDFLQKIYNDIFNKPDDDAKRLRTALKIAQRNLEHAKQRLERAKVGDFSREAKRKSVTSAELESLRQQRDSINALIEQLQEEMAPEINAEKRLQRWRKSAHQRIAMYDERIENEDFAKKPVNVRTLSEEDYKLHRKLENKKREFTRKMEAWREKNQPLPAKIVSRVRKTSELVKAIRASYDWSALGRQGLWSSLAHPILAAKAINQMARATFSQINADRYFDEMQLDPDFQRAEQAGLALVDPSADAVFAEKEEQFAGRIQRFGGKAGSAFFAGIDASDRAYSTFLNFMRFEMFKSILRQHPTGNPTLQELKVIGHFVNAATGRGDITSNPQFAKGLSAILWAPRLQMSRIQMMLGEPIARAALHKESWATKAISKEYGRMMLGTGVIGLIAWLFASLFNDDDDPRPNIGLDSRSTQFGKVRYGDQFLDLTGGAGQMVVLGTKIITGERKTKYGQVVDLRGPNKGYKESTWSEITSALRGKLLPIIGLSFDLVEGESMVGESTRNLPYVARSLLVPLGIDQMIETAVEDGWAPGMLVGAAELLGFSASNYQTEIFRFVERDYMSASKAWRDAKTQQERDAVLLRAPFLKNKGQLDAIRSRINKIKRTMKRYEEGGLDTTPLENQLAQAQAQFHQIMVEANK